MGKKHIILVIDDQDGVRKLLAEVLRSDDREIHLLNNGEEGMEFIRSTTPELILLDMKMPGMSGLEVTRELKKAGFEGAIIFMTAYGELEIITEAKSLGITAYINKPFDVNEIRNLVTGILDGTFTRE
ncbi:response regulator [Metallumcola ferriviriculae]|uniref:Stage 0 sporulation protein A homolog n=1 Tax=Metallumcola ferriviriculae TaxID=3039180 RepID=A0AAU0UJ35_9FIRM|nr:response regulator [Desulfitibacteraceae bacterium MK1]